MNNKNTLIVSETFYSIQGEGISMGHPAVFLRLAGCNLLCDGQWRCDTIEVWQHGKAIKFEDVLTPLYISYLQEGAHLVITGGEPMLHEKAIAEFLFWLSGIHDVTPYVEIETNGTIKPTMLGLGNANFVQQWNVSFKLSNSGEPYSKRINEVALDWFEKHPRAWFKIVINNDYDFMELMQDFNFPKRKYILMPAGSTQEELAITRPHVLELCKAHGIKYCDRLHIVAWNKKTGV